MAATRSLISSAICALVLYAWGLGQALATTYTIQELLPLPGHNVAHANAVNSEGQVVGYSYFRPPHGFLDGALLNATYWDQNGVHNLDGGPGFGAVWNAVDINDLGQIVGIARVDDLIPQPSDSGGIGSPASGGFGNWITLAPGSSASLPTTNMRCGLDVFLSAITNSGYMVGSGGLFSPNTTAFLCGLNVLQLYEEGLAVTPGGYLFDPFVDFFYDQGSPIEVNARQWVLVPSCVGDVTGYAMSAGAPFVHSTPLSLQVSDQVAASICDLATSGELHIKQQNESGQFILNAGDRAFLYTPCSDFPGGGATGGCFPGPGTFPAPAPATLALVAIGVAGLSCSRRRDAAARRRRFQHPKAQRGVSRRDCAETVLAI